MKKDKNTISDYICLACVIIMTMVSVALAIYILKPEKAYIQEWTSPAGITYYVSNMHIQAASDNHIDK